MPTDVKILISINLFYKKVVSMNQFEQQLLTFPPIYHGYDVGIGPDVTSMVFARGVIGQLKRHEAVFNSRHGKIIPCLEMSPGALFERMRRMFSVTPRDFFDAEDKFYTELMPKPKTQIVWPRCNYKTNVSRQLVRWGHARDRENATNEIMGSPQAIARLIMVSNKPVEYPIISTKSRKNVIVLDSFGGSK